jgi:hypothetical protein
MSNDKKSDDSLQNFTTFLGAASLIGALTAGVNQPPEQPKGNETTENEPPTSHTTRIMQNTAAAVVGGGFTVAALNRLRNREEKQKEKQKGEGRSV